MANRWGNNGNKDFILGGSKILQIVTVATKLTDACSLEEKLWLTQTAYLKAETLLCQQRFILVKIYGFSSIHVFPVWMCELDYKESWMPKKWCFWTVVLEKTPESPLECKDIKPVNPKGNQSWTFIGKIDVEAETPILWPFDAKNWLIGKDPDAGKDWRQEEKGMTADEMVGWHYQLDGHEFEQALSVGDGQGSLVCCSPWVIKSQTWLSN